MQVGVDLPDITCVAKCIHSYMHTYIHIYIHYITLHYIMLYYIHHTALMVIGCASSHFTL